jgi:hypothetical protein
MVGDYIFALWNHLLGGISAQEMEVYEDEFGGLFSQNPFFSNVFESLFYFRVFILLSYF